MIKIIKEENNYLELEISKTNNYEINLFKHFLTTYYLSFAFNKNNINIEKNDSVFNDDELKLRFSNIPVYGIENKEELIDEHYLQVLENYLNNKDFNENIESELSKIDKLEVICNKKNKESRESIKVTTNDCEYFYFDSKTKNTTKIENPYKNNPIILCWLKGNEELQFNMNSEIGLGIRNQMWSQVYNYKFNALDEDETKYNFSFYTYYDNAKYVFNMIIKIINIIIEKYINNINNLKEIENNQLIIKGFKHAFSAYIVRRMQDNGHIVSYNVPFNDVEESIIKFSNDIAKDGKELKNIFINNMKDTIKHLKDNFSL